MDARKRCIICGARSRGATCGPTCTRARKAGITYEEQLRRDMDKVSWSFRDFELHRNGCRSTPGKSLVRS